MDRPLEEPKRISRRKGKADMKVGDIKQQPRLTKTRFERLLRKAAQPVSEWQHGQEEPETSVAHPSDGCIGKHKSQDKTEGKED